MTINRVVLCLFRNILIYLSFLQSSTIRMLSFRLFSLKNVEKSDFRPLCSYFHFFIKYFVTENFKIFKIQKSKRKSPKYLVHF